MPDSSNPPVLSQPQPQFIPNPPVTIPGAAPNLTVPSPSLPKTPQVDQASKDEKVVPTIQYPPFLSEKSQNLQVGEKNHSQN